MLPLIQFDVKESDLLFNTELFPLKRQVNQKIYILFEQIKLKLKDTEQHKQFIFPTGTDSETGKISQGENYLSFPWVMLDFPKLFNKEDIFSFRTLFWYGHYFSFSLVLGGISAEIYLPLILKNRDYLKNMGLYFSIHEDPWQHDINAENSQLLEQTDDLSIEKQVLEHGFVKITRKIQSFDTEEISKNVEEMYVSMLKTLSGSTNSDH